MAKNTDLNETLEAWADITLRKWQENIQRLGIGEKQELLDSLRHTVSTQAGGQAWKIEFFYKYYGAFVDMGVGKGTKIADVAENKLQRRLMGRATAPRRRAKPWKSRTLYAEATKLNIILTKKLGRLVVGTVSEIFTTTIDIKVK